MRLDTSEALVDRSLWDELGDFKPTGVNERLVWKVRDALDERGYDRLRIVVSGGFNVEKIREFEEKGVPVDAYGVGSSLIRGSNDFTGDIVLTDGQPSAKVGRRYRENPRLELVDVRADPLGRRHAGRLHGAERQALRPEARRTSRRRWSGSSTRRAPPRLVHVASADDHELTDPEISDAPDFENTYPRALPARHARRREDPRDEAA